MRRIFFVACVFLLAGCQSVPTKEQAKATLESSDVGMIAFKAERNFWNGKESEYLLGTLEFPKTDDSNEQFPVMVIMHGSSGMGYRGETWGEFLRGHGVATFRVDYHSPRGLNKPGPKGPKTQHDIFSAIRVLSTHPRVDTERFGVMGFSRGGTMALMSTDYKSRDTNGIDPKAFIAIYPGCGAFSVGPYTTDAPILVLAGDKDTLSPPKRCYDRKSESDEHNKNFQLVVYQNAYHGFDGERARSFMWRGKPAVLKPDAESTKKARSEVLRLLNQTLLAQ